MGRSPIHGFSLLELLTALAIVAILVTVTIPSYSGFVARSRRGDAVSALLQVQLAQERWRAAHAGFAADLAALGRRSAGSPDGYYRLRIGPVSATDYVVTAQPVGVQAGDSCGTFAIDASGPRYTDGFADQTCWRR